MAGDFTLFAHNVQSVSRRFTSISIGRAGDMCLHMRADYTRGAGFASITSANSDVSAPVR